MEIKSGTVRCWDCDWEDSIQDDIEIDVYCQNCGSSEMEVDWEE